MTIAPAASTDRPTRQPLIRSATSVLAPLGAIALAYGLWWISDRLLTIGPLDRAAFGWVVVVPVWLAIPFVAAVVWRSLSPRATLGAAVMVGAIVSCVSASLFWRAVAFPDCANGAIRSPAEWVLASLLIGVVIGGGVAASGLVAVRILRGGHPWRALVAGAAASFAMVWLAVAAFAMLASTSVCQRPPLA